MSGIDRYLIRVLRMLMDWYDIWRGRVNGACVYVARENMGPWDGARKY